MGSWLFVDSAAHEDPDITLKVEELGIRDESRIALDGYYKEFGMVWELARGCISGPIHHSHWPISCAAIGLSKASRRTRHVDI